MFQFNLHLDLGQVAIFLSILGMGWGIQHKLDVYLMEHEILIAKYCEDMGIEIHEFPTRIRRGR